jgi:hypothetical protein
MPPGSELAFLAVTGEGEASGAEFLDDRHMDGTRCATWASEQNYEVAEHAAGLDGDDGVVRAGTGRR